jgi:hypothetical protein
VNVARAGTSGLGRVANKGAIGGLHAADHQSILLVAAIPIGLAHTAIMNGGAR